MPSDFPPHALTRALRGLLGQSVHNTMLVVSTETSALQSKSLGALSFVPHETASLGVNLPQHTGQRARSSAFIQVIGGCSGRFSGLVSA